MQSLTLGESKKIMLQLIDEYSLDGYVTSELTNADYLHKHNIMADLVQMELAQHFPLASTYHIHQLPLGQFLLAGGFGKSQPPVGKEYVISAPAAKSYYFEIAGPARIQLEKWQDGGWQLVKEISHAPQNSNEFISYKGNVPDVAPLENVRLVFQADFPYSLQNVALYAYHFISDDQVPLCRPWLRYPMPDDFMRLAEVVAEQDRQYEQSVNYRWEGDRVLVLPHNVSAQLTIHYWRYPKAILANSPDRQEIDLAPDVARLIPFKVAAMTIPCEKQALSTRLLELYEAELSRITALKAVEPGGVSPVYHI